MLVVILIYYIYQICFKLTVLMVTILANCGILNFLLLEIQDNEILAGVLKAGILVDMIKNGNAIMDVFIAMLILTIVLMKTPFKKFNQ